jgi:riboflavin synthase
MFTGIITEVGRLVRINSGSGREGAFLSLEVEAQGASAGTAVGGSVAVNGVCLTVRRLDGSVMVFDVLDETVRRSSLGDLNGGDGVNLELPLTPSSQLGGHLVTGHVDDVVRVDSISRQPGGTEWRLQAEERWLAYVVEKGSVALDGVSLTAYDVDRTGFRVSLIPHSLDATRFRAVRPGDRLNLEVDILAKYVAKIHDGNRDLHGERGGEGLTFEKLSETGFI